MINPVIISKWLPALCVVLMSGCATIVSKSEYDVHVSCNLHGTFVNVYQGDDLITSSVAPTVITLSSKRGYFRPASYRFEFMRNGFKDNVELDAKFDWWYLGNFILPYGIVWALTVDPLTGAMWKFDEDAGVYGRIDFAGEAPSVEFSNVLADATGKPLQQSHVQTNAQVAVNNDRFK